MPSSFRYLTSLGCGLFFLLAATNLTRLEAESSPPSSASHPNDPIDAGVAGRSAEAGDQSPRTDEDAPETPKPAELEGWQTHAMQEILHIRREQEDLFRGTVFDEMTDSDTEDAFVRALHDVVQQQPTPIAANRNDAITATRESTVARQAHQEHQTVMVHTLVSALRDACRELDTTANNLEEVCQYDEADRLRSLSLELRLEARHWVAETQAAETQAAETQAGESRAYGSSPAALETHPPPTR